MEIKEALEKIYEKQNPFVINVAETLAPLLGLKISEVYRQTLDYVLVNKKMSSQEQQLMSEEKRITEMQNILYNYIIKNCKVEDCEDSFIGKHKKVTFECPHCKWYESESFDWKRNNGSLITQDEMMYKISGKYRMHISRKIMKSLDLDHIREFKNIFGNKYSMIFFKKYMNTNPMIGYHLLKILEEDKDGN